MAAVTVFLALLAIAVLVALVQAFRQNRSLWPRVLDARRPVPILLRDALMLWSPLALVILVLVLVANCMSATAVSLAYRLTTLDEFCEVQGLPGNLVIPCTGLEGVLARQLIRHEGAQSDLDVFVSGRYQEARQLFLGRSADELRQLAANQPAFYRSLAPAGVLGLELAPEDDQELVRLKMELRDLVRTPAKPADGVLDFVRYVTDRDARVQRIRTLTAMVIARRKLVSEAAYGGLSPEAQGRLWIRHRISHLLAGVQARPDAATLAALGQLTAERGPGEDPEPAVRRGFAAMLARNEASVFDLLAQEAETSHGAAALGIALDMPRLCTVAAADPALRMRAADFAGEDFDPVDLDKLTLSNSGTFTCPDLTAAPEVLQLNSLGFRQSVQRSIDRWYDDVARTSFRRLGRLSLSVAAGATDASSLARELASVAPTGIHLGRADCGWLRPGNCAANVVREAAEASIGRARADLASNYEQVANATASAAALTLDQRIGQSLVVLDGQLDSIRASTHAYMDRLFLVSTLLRVLGWLALALLVIKSFLYVLALELFHSDEDMSFGFENAAQIEGEYRSARQLTIDRDFPHPIITRKQLSNTDNNVCLAPWPWSSPISRILHGRYFIFTKGSFLADRDKPLGSDPAPRGMVASAGGGLSIVEWKMQPGEQVIFRYKDFFGASENVQLRSEISFRLSTLLLGRIVFHSACATEGEARLLLKANVEGIDQEHIRAVPPERMIAWNRHAQFTIHSGRTAWKTLLNGYTLVRSDRTQGGSGRILVSSDDAGSNLGSIRYIKRIFSAIF